MNSELKPKIRFKGFTDDWEQRKLGDVSYFKQGNQVDLSKQYNYSNDKRVRFIRIVDYTQNTDDIRFIDKNNSYDVINVDDVVVVRYGATAGFVGHGIKGVLANNMFTVNPSKEVNKNYLYTYLKQDKIYQLLNNSNGYSAMPALNFGTVKNVDIVYPIYNEQIKISDTFSMIDNLITLHQRKCDKLVELKKSLLEKMFPQNNSVIPEIRFKGFTDDWEQRKYKDIGIPLSGGNLSYDSLDDDGDKKCVLYGDLYTKYDCIIQDIKNRTFELGNSIIKNDILFPQSTTVDAYSLISPACLNEENAETSGVFVIRPYKNINGNFICYYTKGNIEQRKKLSKKAQGLTIVHLYYHSIKEESIMIPYKDEQDKIASVLLDLDNLITLHQRKHDKLNKIKQSLLNDMFV